MSDVITVTDLEETKKHNTFHVDVITGRTGEYATNAVTGQVQKTLPATINGIDWYYVGKFADGVTFTKKTDFAIDASGTQWIYVGSDPFPKSVAGGAVPSEPDYQVVHVGDHNLTTNRNAVGAHDEIYSRNFDVLSDAVNQVGLRDGCSVHIKEHTRGNGGGAIWDVVLLSSVTPNTFDVVACVGEPTLALVIRCTDGTIRPSQIGFLGESLSPDTQDYKGVTYNVERWSQNQDFLKFLPYFFSNAKYRVLDIEDKFLYMSTVSIEVWNKKRITGSGGYNCGFIYGGFNWKDGTKSAKVDRVGFYGKIAERDLPLPATNKAGEALDQDKFYIFDAEIWGYGQGALGAATVSEDGNTDDIIVENCYFEMRGGIIGGGSAPNNEDRPKVTNVIFKNNHILNCVSHGYSSIHFKYAKAYGNHFSKLYNGFAADVSLGSVDCEFYGNTGDKLAGAFKAETREFASGNRGCKFYDNHLEVDGSFGAAFNIGVRNTGANTEIYDNTIILKDYAPEDNIGNAIYGLRTVVKNNEFYIRGSAPSPALNWFFDVRNHPTGATGQQAIIEDNNIYNQTSLKIPVGLWLSTFSSADIVSSLHHSRNKYFGLWDAMVRADYTNVNDLIQELVIEGNSFTNTALFEAGSQITITNLYILDNKCVGVEFTPVCNISFVTIQNKLMIKRNTVTNGNDSSGLLSFVSRSVAGGTIENADIVITDNEIDGISGALCYLFAGGAIQTKSVIIKDNTVLFTGTTPYTSQVHAAGASRFLMHANILINDRAVSNVGIVRPANSPNSQYLDNMTVGTVLDFPS